MDLTTEFERLLNTASYGYSYGYTSCDYIETEGGENNDVKEEKELLESVKGFLAVYISQLLDDPDELIKEALKVRDEEIKYLKEEIKNLKKEVEDLKKNDVVDDIPWTPWINNIPPSSISPLPSSPWSSSTVKL